ncbi:succinate dehydrogenase, cytochrome b556 subunit [Yunchengibacter salinarum]|uniref:succinate dehydrogenase, cytochrome b556 subunit n=1 Tax=Yunchengibacter salinarum TaxID=3133399 RepID=UPI0035B5A4B4
MSEARNKVRRPLSPHLQVYRWGPHMLVSILHRVTGSANAVGTVLLAWWLYAMADGKAHFDYVQGLAGSVIGQVVLFGFTLALMQHMASGVRHLVMDTGRGLAPGPNATWARITLVFSLVATILIFVAAYAASGRL